MFFYENEGQNWDMSKEEMALDVLKWGDSKEEDDEAENVGELGAKVNENEEAGSNGTNKAGSSGTSLPFGKSPDENSSDLVEGGQDEFHSGCKIMKPVRA